MHGGSDRGDRPPPRVSKKIEREPQKDRERGKATCKRSFTALRRERNYLRSDISGNVTQRKRLESVMVQCQIQCDA